MKVRWGVIRGSLYVLVSITLIFLWLSKEAEGAETYVEVGPTIVSYQHSGSITLILQERWHDKYAVSLGIITAQEFNTCPECVDRPDHHWNVGTQLLVGAERIIRGNFKRLTWLNRISMSIGPYWFQNKSRISSCNFNVRIGLEAELTDRLGIKASHFSHANSCSDLTLENPNDTRPGGPHPITDNWNLGQDALLVTWQF
jgi:hypothetical protein